MPKIVLGYKKGMISLRNHPFFVVMFWFTLHRRNTMRELHHVRFCSDHLSCRLLLAIFCFAKASCFVRHKQSKLCLCSRLSQDVGTLMTRVALGYSASA